jgi:hypothetical protein
MASFWTDLNGYLVDMFTDAMGTGSGYSTLQAQTINDHIYPNAVDWTSWDMPAISVGCHKILYTSNEHMGSERRLYKKVYKCRAFGLISGVISGPTDTISDNLREYFERMEAALVVPAVALTSNNQVASRITITTGECDVVRYANKDIDSTSRIGVAYFEFDVVAKR